MYNIIKLTFKDDAMVKQDDIAKILNVSRTTVARALNGKGNIKPDTKKKILDLCDEMGYVKNPISTSLALKNEKNIYAFLVRGRNNYYTDTLIKGLKYSLKELRMYKINLFIFETDIDYPDVQIEKLEKIIRTNRVDGIIITPLLKEKIKKIKKENSNIIFIALDQALDRSTYNISSNYEKIGRIMGNVLSNSLNPKEKVLLIETEDDMVSAKDGFKGVCEKLKEDNKCEIIGPIYEKNLKQNYRNVINEHLDESIKSIYASRFMDDIIEYVYQKDKTNLKIVTLGLSENTINYIKSGKVLASITPDYYKIGYMSLITMFNYLYKGIVPEKIKVEYESKIIVKENL